MSTKKSKTSAKKSKPSAKKSKPSAKTLGMARTAAVSGPPVVTLVIHVETKDNPSTGHGRGTFTAPPPRVAMHRSQQVRWRNDQRGFSFVVDFGGSWPFAESQPAGGITTSDPYTVRANAPAGQVFKYSVGVTDNTGGIFGIDPDLEVL
jgi:hypothetical protein